MDGWMDVWMDEWTDGWVVGWMEEWMNRIGWINGWMDGWMDDGWVNGWMDGGMNGCTEGWMDGRRKVRLASLALDGRQGSLRSPPRGRTAGLAPLASERMHGLMAGLAPLASEWTDHQTLSSYNRKVGSGIPKVRCCKDNLFKKASDSNLTPTNLRATQSVE